MEITDPLSNTGQLSSDASPIYGNSRLDALLAANAAIARHKRRYPTRLAEVEAMTMRRPLDMPRAYSYLGLMLGVFPPATLFFAYLGSFNSLRNSYWAALFLLWVNFVTAASGYLLGKVVGKQVAGLAAHSFTALTLLLSLIGFLWGAASGAAGGVFIFLFGAFFGAMTGGIVGGLAVPVFYLFHKLAGRGDLIELRHFLPIAFGITFSICAIILRIFGL